MYPTLLKYCIHMINHFLQCDSVLEMIQRRNIHVHKKGIVDEKYLSKGNGAQLGLKIGDYATIDNSYYLNVYETLGNFVDNFQ